MEILTFHLNWIETDMYVSAHLTVRTWSIFCWVKAVKWTSWTWQKQPLAGAELKHTGRELIALQELWHVFNACCPLVSLQGARCVTRRIHQTARTTGPSPLSPTAQSRAEPGCPCRSSCSSGSPSWELKRVRITLLGTSCSTLKYTHCWNPKPWGD